MTNEEIIAQVNALVSPHGLRAEVFQDTLSVGVAGDNRIYLPVVCLIGPFPGHKTLSELSTKITNTVRVSRVAFQIAERQE